MTCKIRLSLAVLCLAGAAAALLAAGPKDDRAAHVERGRYLVNSHGCFDCHSPKTMTADGPVPDAALELSGHRHDLVVPEAPAAKGPWVISTTGELTAWNGPWGTSFARNLTPDVETGLGSWSEEEFVATIKTGRTRGRGRKLLPPMPIPAFSQISEEDLRDMWAYLRSLPAVSNHVPEPQPPAGSS